MSSICSIICQIWCENLREQKSLCEETTAFNINNNHGAGLSRRHVQTFSKKFKNVNIIELHYHIWNHHEKCIPKSPNMSSICSIICEIYCDILREKNPICSYFLFFFSIFPKMRMLSVMTARYKASQKKCPMK